MLKLSEKFKRSNLLTFTSKWEDIKKCNFFIVTFTGDR